MGTSEAVNPDHEAALQSGESVGGLEQDDATFAMQMQQHFEQQDAALNQANAGEGAAPPVTGPWSRGNGVGGFMFGFLLGGVLGIWSVIWLWQRGVPRSQKLGVLLGLILNLVYNSWGYTDPTQTDGDDDGNPNTDN
jgi:hypothetical protein